MPCILLVLSLTSFAQNQHVRQIDLKDGLSNNYVVSLAYDKLGALWIATEDGLNRFDGNKVTSYQSQYGANTLSENALNCLLDNPTEKEMWIGTQRSGINVYDYENDCFEYFRHSEDDPNSLCYDGVTGFCASDDGGVWIATYGGGIDLWNSSDKIFLHFNTNNVAGLESNQFWCVLDIGNGKIIGGHVDHGLSIIDTSKRTAVNYRHDKSDPKSISADEVTSLLKDSNGRIWIGTGKGLDLFDPVRNEFLHYHDGNHLEHRIFDIKEFPDGKLWVSAELAGITIIDPKNIFSANRASENRHLTSGLSPESLYGNTVRSMVGDGFGNVWLGLYGEGLNFIPASAPPFLQITYSEFDSPFSITNRSVLGIAIDGENNLWVGTDGTGVNIFNNAGEREQSVKIFPDQAIQGILCTADGNIIVGCFNSGAYVTKGVNGQFRPLFPHHSSIDVRTFYEDEEGQIWICTNDGLYMSKPKSLGKEETYLHYVPTGTTLVRSVCKDESGNLWVGTFNAGLEVLSPEMKLLRQFGLNNEFPSNSVNHIFKDSQGRMWVATSEGLVGFGEDWQYHVYGLADGLANMNTRSITEDKEGNLWVSTNNGISCQRRGAEKFESYDYRDNLPAGNFNAACVAQSKDGVICFGSNNGIAIFRPEDVLADHQAPSLVVTSIVIKNTRQDADKIINLLGKDHIVLDHLENIFQLYYCTTDYALSNMSEYQYRVSNEDDGWLTATDNNIPFTKLAPGSYKLDIRCRLHNKGWSPVTSFDIRVKPPIWLTPWAKALYILLTLGIILLSLNFYMRHVRLKYLYESEKKNREMEQELNEERIHFYTNITHELRTPLTLIIGPLEDLTHDPEIKGAQAKKIKGIYKSAERLNDLISKLLEFRKTESMSRRLNVGRSNIVSSLREMYNRYEDLYSSSPVMLEFESSQDIINMYFDKDVLTIIIDNLVSNAIKYTEKGKITLGVYTAQKDGKQLVQIYVRDTGHGIDPDSIPHIFERFYQVHGPHQAPGTGIGLSLVKNLVELHQGTISVESEPEKGSTFTVSLDRNATYGKADTAEESVEGQTPVSKTKDISRQRPVLLIVEDNGEICQYIADCFSDHFDIEMAENGKDGVQKAFSTIPDIIISDVMMPQMSGTDLCKVLKSDIRTCHVPIILLTAKDSTEAKLEGYDAGADSYITKPFIKPLIESRINNLLEQRKRVRLALGGSSSTYSDAEAKRKLLESSLNKLDKEFLDNVNTLISNHIDEETIDTAFLSDHLNISSSTLYRKMKSLTGLSTNEYVRKQKMILAEKMLLEGKYTISEISYKIGMNTTAYFRKCFKDEFGKTPSEYLEYIKSQTEVQ